MARSGGALFDAMAALRDARDPGVPGIDLATINGGDTDLVIEALVGMEEFDFSRIADDVIVDMVLAYVTQCIYEQIVLDSRDAFAKATAAGRVEQTEKAMRDLVCSAADKHMAPLLTGNIRTLNGHVVETAQLRAIADIWAEWGVGAMAAFRPIVLKHQT